MSNKNIYLVSEALYGEPQRLSIELLDDLYKVTIKREVVGRWYKTDITKTDVLGYVMDTALLMYEHRQDIDAKLLNDGVMFTLSRIYNHMGTKELSSDITPMNMLISVVYSKLKYEIDSMQLYNKERVGSLRLHSINNNLAYICVSPIYILSSN